MSAALIERCFQSYRFLGPPSTQAPAAFLYHPHAALVHASLTPCFLRPHAPLTASDLADLARTVPFFSAVDGPWHDMAAVRAAVSSMGWSELWRTSLECWESVVPAPAVDGYELEIGDPRVEPALNQRVNRLGQDVFGMPPEMTETLIAITAGAAGEVFAVVARAPDGTDAAAGLVFCNERTAFLAGGVVAAAHRRRGLWRQLLRQRQLITQSAGVDRWVYTTSSPHLSGRADKRFEMLTFGGQHDG